MPIDLSRTPRLQTELIGHAASMQQLTEQYQSGRLHPAWLLSGQKGIGKATLAYQFARHVLTAGQENSAFYNSLIDQNAHPNLFILERLADEDGKVDAEIKIDQVRGLSDFARQSPALPGWRVVIIDAIDELNRNAANSILKILEEPPRQLLFLMVCHSIGSILPTIRSRCCLLSLQQLTSYDLAAAGVVQNSALVSELSGGSIGQSLALQSINALELLGTLTDLAFHVCQGRIQPMTTFCATLEKKDLRTELIPGLLVWLSRQLVLTSVEVVQENELSQKLQALSRLAPPQHWIKVHQAISQMVDLARGAHPDPIHLIQALFLLVKAPQRFQA
ncbi:AAA family ATPase [Candidatus Odyssella thessalonicensis]|uniref:AAA family ATPase n=1 Tax=Candidatus Odyssella thessalonicensis TaxID=84647 RepID=UPI000225BC50|nr:AAA family ATPase [Candidatus Odyssella thessalonicensis]